MIDALVTYLSEICSLFVDIDECSNRSHVCDVNANCTNTNGSHNCSCKEGYTENGQVCSGALKLLMDVITYSISNGCHNCSCKEGYIGDGRSCSDKSH